MHVPLPEKHPEFTVHNWPGFTEYRVENWRLARGGNGRVIRGTSVCSWLDGVVLALAAAIFQTTSRPLVLVTTIAVLTLLWVRCTQVLHESVLVFSSLGIQLETHRGHPLFPSLNIVTRQFIQLDTLEDVIIHEGFRRWQVRFYLAALQRRGGWCTCASTGSEDATIYPDGDTTSPMGGRIHVIVAFKNILPHFPVLMAVYLGVQETLFPPPTRVMDMDGSVDSESAPEG